MNKTESKRADKWIHDVMTYVAEYEEKPVNSEDVIQMMSVPASKNMIIRGYYAYMDEDTKPGWTRAKIMDYGSRVIARSIVMNKLPVID